VHPLLQKLFELYPRLFGARFLPLKVGVFEDLVAAHPEALPAAELKVALGLHTRSTRYIESVASGLARHDLQARPVEPVAPEHVHHAILELYKRRSGKAPERARQHAVEQLAAAIEVSGLSREAYRERFTSPDDNLQSLLEDALAIVAQKRARREALQTHSGQRQDGCRVRRDVWVGPDGSEKAAGVSSLRCIAPVCTHWRASRRSRRFRPGADAWRVPSAEEQCSSDCGAAGHMG
jgi:sRNA-binding protein